MVHITICKLGRPLISDYLLGVINIFRKRIFCKYSGNADRNYMLFYVDLRRSVYF